MRTTAFFFLLSLLLPGCTGETEKKISVTEEKKESSENDSILSDKEELIRERDSLLQFFEYRKFDLPSSSYYNKAWWNHYWLREHILMAGVDSTGNYFLTMTTFFPPGAKTNHTDTVEVMVYTKNDSALTDSRLETDTVLMNYEKQALFIGTWNPEFHVYDRAASKEVMEFISSHRNENMHFILLRKGKKYDGPYSVGQKSRDAITQCYALGNAMTGIKK